MTEKHPVLVGREQRLRREEEAWEENDRIGVKISTASASIRVSSSSDRGLIVVPWTFVFWFWFILCGDSPPPPVRLSVVSIRAPASRGATEGR